MYDLKLTTEQFWSLTPAQFFALSARHKNSNRIADYRTGVIAQILANVYRPEDHPGFAVEDFMPTVAAAPKPEPKVAPEKLRSKLRALVGAPIQ